MSLHIDTPFCYRVIRYCTDHHTFGIYLIARSLVSLVRLIRFSEPASARHRRAQAEPRSSFTTGPARSRKKPLGYYYTPTRDSREPKCNNSHLTLSESRVPSRIDGPTRSMWEISGTSLMPSRHSLVFLSLLMSFQNLASYQRGHHEVG